MPETPTPHATASPAPVSPAGTSATADAHRARSRIGLVLAGPLLALVLIAALSFATIGEVRVGGPQDARRQQAQALVTDTGTPSQNLASLRGVLLALAEPTSPTAQQELRAEVDRAEIAYREGHAYWDAHLSDAALRDVLLIEAHEPVAQLFRLVHERVWPAFDAGDQTTAAATIRTQVLPLLDHHDDAMDRVSTLAVDARSSTVAATDDAVALRTRLLAGVVVSFMLLFAATAIVSARASRRRARPPVDDTREPDPVGPATVETISPQAHDAGRVSEARPQPTGV